jgi:hypothetical protein
MGGNSSKSAVQQTNEFFNKTTFEFMNKNSQTVNAANQGVNTVIFENSDIANCRYYVGQNIDMTTTATGEMQGKTAVDLANELKSKVSEFVDNQAKQSSGFLAPSILNSSEAQTDLKTTVHNIIDQKITNENLQTITASAKGENNFSFKGMKAPCDPAYKLPGKCQASDTSGCDFVVDQNIKTALVAKGMADLLTTALSKTITDNTVDTTVKQSSTQETRGLDDLVKAITSGWGMASLGVCIVIVLIIVLMIVMGGVSSMGKGGGASAVPTAMPNTSAMGGGINAATLAAFMRR